MKKTVERPSVCDDETVIMLELQKLAKVSTRLNELNEPMIWRQPSGHDLNLF